MHYAWLSRMYRLDLEKRPELYDRLKFKLAASEIFKGFIIVLISVVSEIITKRLNLILDRKAMYPTSLQFDLDNDRDKILELLKNVEVDDINPNSAYLVRFFL